MTRDQTKAKKDLAPEEKEDEEVPKGQILMLIQSAILFYLLYQVFHCLDFNIFRDIERVAEEKDVWRDLFSMPVAPHRVDGDKPDEVLFLFHRTETSMADFVQFVENESTQIKEEHDFYLGNDRNKTESARNVNITFTPGQTYSRSTVRRFLYEYYVKRVSWSRHSTEMKMDAARFWFFAKGVKDYIIMTGKEEFSYEDVKEVIESWSILNFTNDIAHRLMREWVLFMDTQLCDHDQSKCDRDQVMDDIHFLRPMNYFLFDPAWTMISRFLETNDTKLFYERLLIFEDWSEHNPIITKENAKQAVELTAEFFSLPLERRGKPLNYTDQFENQNDVAHKQLKRSPLENSNKEHLKMPQHLDRKNIARAFHLSVRELDNPHKTIGHDKYNYYNERGSKDVMWLRFDKPYHESKNNAVFEATMGLPWCIYETLDWIKIDELMWVRCPALSKHDRAQKGMTRDFLKSLGIEDEKYLSGETSLIFEYMVLF